MDENTIVWGKLLLADVVDLDGIFYTAEYLQEVADKLNSEFIYYSPAFKALMYEGPMRYCSLSRRLLLKMLNSKK